MDCLGLGSKASVNSDFSCPMSIRVGEFQWRVWKLSVQAYLKVNRVHNPLLNFPFSKSHRKL